MPRISDKTVSELEADLAKVKERTRERIKELRRRHAIKSRRADAHAKIVMGGQVFKDLELNSVMDLERALIVWRHLRNWRMQNAEGKTVLSRAKEVAQDLRKENKPMEKERRRKK